jgi:hypothetical protein
VEEGSVVDRARWHGRVLLLLVRHGLHQVDEIQELAPRERGGPVGRDRRLRPPLQGVVDEPPEVRKGHVLAGGPVRWVLGFGQLGVPLFRDHSSSDSTGGRAIPTPRVTSRSKPGSGLASPVSGCSLRPREAASPTPRRSRIFEVQLCLRRLPPLAARQHRPEHGLTRGSPQDLPGSPARGDGGRGAHDPPFGRLQPGRLPPECS